MKAVNESRKIAFDLQEFGVNVRHELRRVIIREIFGDICKSWKDINAFEGIVKKPWNGVERSVKGEKSKSRRGCKHLSGRVDEFSDVEKLGLFCVGQSWIVAMVGKVDELECIEESASD